VASSIFSSSGSQLGSSSFTPPSYHAPTKTSGGGSHWYDGITGFIGHLGADIEHSVVGLPMGIVQLIKHPISSIETMGKLTWQDWSPLFHGQFGTFAHNFYEHPLNPILDVLSVATLGGGLAGRVAEGAAEVGVADRAGALARFGNPAKAVLAEHKAAEIAKGASEEDALRTAIKLTAKDPRAYKQVAGPGGTVKYAQKLDKNPFIRLRQQALGKVANKAAESAAGQKIGVQKIMGDQALYRRLHTADKGGRSAAVQQVMHRQVAALHTLGKSLSGMSNEQVYALTKNTMRDGLEAQAHEIPISELPTKTLKDGSTVVDTKALQKRLSADGMRLVKDRAAVTDEATLRHLGKNTDESFKNAMEAWGHDQVTGSFKKAQLNQAKDSILAIPSGSQGLMGQELLNSSRVLKLLYKNPTTVWKWMILAASPRYFVNNVVGNWFMMANSIDPVTLSRAMYTHIKLTRGQRAADAAASDVGRAVNKMTGDVVDRWYSAEYQGHARSMMDERGLPKTGIKAKAKQGLFPVTHTVSDYIPRRAAVIATMQRTPEFQDALALYKRQGLSQAEAFNKAFNTASTSPGVRAFVRQQVNHTLGQYHTFTKTERTVQGIIPFYSWDRAITRHTAELIRSQPYKAAMLSAISAQGVQKTKDMLGQLPSFLQGVIPEEALGGPNALLGALFGGEGKGRKNILTTQSLNPYSTLGDVAGAALTATGLAPGGQGLTLGSTVGSQLNPILSGAAQSLSGTNLSTGAPIKHARGGLIGDIISNLVESTPPAKIGEALLNKYGGGYPQPKKANQPFLYSKDARSQIASLFGFGARQMGLQTAHQLAAKEAGTKTVKLRSGVSTSLGTLGQSSSSSGRVAKPSIYSGFTGGTGTSLHSIRIPSSKIKKIPGL
jgi:hypothetical protein